MDTKMKGIVAYLLIAFGMAWILWEIPIRKGFLTSPLFGIVILPGAFAPAVACIIVRKWITREGFSDAGLRPNFKGNIQYYLFALLLPLPVVFVITLLAVLFGVSEPDFSLQYVLAALPPGTELPISTGILFLIIFVQSLILALIYTPLLWGEEFGWRSYLQIRLCSHNPLLAAVATGIIWGVWHYPLNLRGYNFPVHPGLGLFVFPVSTIFLSIIFGWLRLKTESIWPASLAHAATNAVGASLILLLFSGKDLIFVNYVGILGLIPLGVISAWIVLTGRLTPEKTEPVSIE